MIIVDSALRKREEEGKPIRVAVLGAGYMGRGIAYQILKAVPGMRLVAVYNRTLEMAKRAYQDAGAEDFKVISSSSELEDVIRQGGYAVTDNVMAVCEAEGIDAVVEVTGTIEFAAHAVMRAMEHGKHIVLMNAELDATVGPILKTYADRHGVVLTNSDGDQPGVIMNLFRWVRSIGMNPVLAGNMKGLQDPYRTPETQKSYADQYNQKPFMVTSFADGTKISMEMAVVANATGFRAGKRGMYGPECDHVNNSPDLFPKEQMLQGGLVDYVLGAQPAGGVFVIGHNDEPIQRQYMNYYKMGEGPFYVFYIPSHLCHLETPLTVARAVLFGDASATPLDKPVCEVVAVAKRPLKKGETLDGVGCFTSYGVIDNSEICRGENLLPMGLAEGCTLKGDLPIDTPLTMDDVLFPDNRLCDQLFAEQTARFG